MEKHGNSPAMMWRFISLAPSSAIVALASRPAGQCFFPQENVIN
jgi:hypothetical protein